MDDQDQPSRGPAPATAAGKPVPPIWARWAVAGLLVIMLLAILAQAYRLQAPAKPGRSAVFWKIACNVDVGPLGHDAGFFDPRVLCSRDFHLPREGYLLYALG